MIRKHSVWLWIAVLLTSSLTLTLAKGPADMITISGPGLPGIIEITDRATLALLPMFAPADIEFNNRNGIPEPTVDEGYELVRYFQQGRMLRAIDMAHYYPNPSAGVGYVFYDGFVNPGMSTEFDGKWYPATAKGDAVMQQLIAQHSDRLLPTIGAAAPPAVRLLVITGSLSLLLIGSIARHRSIHRHVRAK